METTFIYALNDPETGECRYVGKANDPHDRLFGSSGHLWDARNTKKTYHCVSWIRSLLNRGLVPLLEILQEVPDTEWELWERAWIKASRKIGMDLTNGTDGGDSGPIMRGDKHPLFGKTPSPETRAKIGAAQKGKKLSPEHRAKIGRRGEKNLNFGKKLSSEHRAKLSAAHIGLRPRLGKKCSLETREKLRIANRGKKLSPEAIEKIRVANRGKKRTPTHCLNLAQSHLGFKKIGASSSFRGVHWASHCNKWRVTITVEKKSKNLGIFADEIEAAKAYDIAAKKYHGASAKLNFPD